MHLCNNGIKGLIIVYNLIINLIKRVCSIPILCITSTILMDYEIRNQFLEMY